MPSRNTRRLDVDEMYYHVYARGINKSNIFKEDDDKKYFLYLISRHLSVKPVTTRAGYTYPNYRRSIELLSYCVMDNHFHLLIHQQDKGTLAHFMQSIMSAYVAYYNKKHVRRGPLFESRFKASMVNDDVYLLHISRYIHLNPRYWKHYEFSSIRSYIDTTTLDWLQSEKLMKLFKDRGDYRIFLEEYIDKRDEINAIKKEIESEFE